MRPSPVGVPVPKAALRSTATFRGPWRPPTYPHLFFTLVLMILAFLVLYPVGLLLVNSFRVGPFGQATDWGLDNWVSALTQPRMQSAIANTLGLTAARQGVAFFVGVALAWLIARTDLPGRNWLEFGFWIAFFLPSLTSTLGWILLLDPDYGLVNQALMRLPFVTSPPFDIFSWWGIVFAHLASGTIAVKVMLLTPAFRNMDAALEEASRTSGASPLGTLARVVVPIMAPTLFIVFLLGTIRSMEAFEIELILGAPARIDVYSTVIYRQIFDAVPQYGTATALSMLILVLILPFVVLQQWLTHRRSHATVSGKYTGHVQRLGPWRWPLFSLVALLLTCITLIPVSLVVMGTFMKKFGFFNVPTGVWTTANWQGALNHPGLLNSLNTTLILGMGAATLSVVVFSLVAYISVRTRYAGRSVLDFLTWLPTAIPGIVLSLGFLWLFLGTPVFRPVYGTVWILIIAVTLAAMTTGVQLLKTSMVQLGAELEEASSASGAGGIYTFRRVVLPLIAPSLAVVAVLSFAGAARATSLVALLSTGATKPLSMLQLDFMADGSYERATVVGVLVLLLTVGVALVARVFGLRLGVQRG